MTEKSRIWIKDNVMSIILAAMFSGFFTVYILDRSEMRQTAKVITQHETMINNLIAEYSWLKDCNKEQDKLLIELFKLTPRGVKVR